MADAEMAYRVAEERIAEAKATGAKWLTLSSLIVQDEAKKSNGAQRAVYLESIPPEISELVNLESLKIDTGRSIKLSPLKSLQSIKHLELRFSSGNLDKETIVELKSLKSISIEEFKIESSLEFLARLPNLESLALDHCYIEDINYIDEKLNIKQLSLVYASTNIRSPIRLPKSLNYINVRKGTFSIGKDLVAPGATWENDNFSLQKLIGFDDTQIGPSGEYLSDLLKHDLDDAPTILGLLRQARDRDQHPQAPAQPPPFVFLSYARAEADRARLVRRALEAEGIAVFQDRDLRAGEDFRAGLAEKLEESAACLVLWSGASTASAYVVSEAERARMREKLVPVRISPGELPPPFDTLNTPDLSGWEGDREDERFRHLVRSLRWHLLGAASPVTVTEDEGRLVPRERPVGARPPRDDRAARDNMMRAQAGVATGMANALEEEAAAGLTNADRRIAFRLRAYAAALAPQEAPLWEPIDAAFVRLSGILHDEALDGGFIDNVAPLRATHGALRFYIQPAQPDQPETTDEVEPEKAAPVVEPLRALRDLTAAEARLIDPKIPVLIADAADRIGAERSDPDSASPAAAERGQKRTGKAIRLALGLATGLANALHRFTQFHTYLNSEAGRILLARLGEAISSLARLLGL